jgi:hypothetical protein
MEELLAYKEVFILAVSPKGPKLLARLSPRDWGETNYTTDGIFLLRECPQKGRAEVHAAPVSKNANS